MNIKVAPAPFLRQLPVKHQLNGVFKAAVNKIINFFSICVLLLNDNQEDEYAFLDIDCKQLDIFLRSHVHEVNA